MAINRFFNPVHKMASTFVISLAVIAALSIFVYVTLERIVAEQASAAPYINISGQQRMLSQRIAFLTADFKSTGANSSKVQAEVALKKMQRNHEFLLKEHWAAVEQNRPSPLSKTMHAIYFSEPHHIDKRVVEFTTLIQHDLASYSTNQIADTGVSNVTLMMVKDIVLNDFDRAVTQYEKESQSVISDLQSVQKVVLLLIVFTVLIECLFIIRPLLAKSDEYSEDLYKEANNDYLTGLLNRRSFTVLADQAIASSKRYKSPLSIITFDIDRFKDINDKYGHGVGDKVLQRVAETMENYSRHCDSVFRFGGEEFVMLLPQTERIKAIRLAEKIRQKVTQDSLAANSTVGKITVSCGVSDFKLHEQNLEPALKRADDALYKAKSQGRDCVMQTAH
jgi:diguanylate cyclase (GGDEF)-like protein